MTSSDAIRRSTTSWWTTNRESWPRSRTAWGDRVTTIFPRQGQYARDAKAYRPADLTVERIGDLLTHDLSELLSPEVTR